MAVTLPANWIWLSVAREQLLPGADDEKTNVQLILCLAESGSKDGKDTEEAGMSGHWIVHIVNYAHQLDMK